MHGAPTPNGRSAWRIAARPCRRQARWEAQTPPIGARNGLRAWIASRSLRRSRGVYPGPDTDLSRGHATGHCGCPPSGGLLTSSRRAETGRPRRRLARVRRTAVAPRRPRNTPGGWRGERKPRGPPYTVAPRVVDVSGPAAGRGAAAVAPPAVGRCGAKDAGPPLRPQGRFASLRDGPAGRP